MIKTNYNQFYKTFELFPTGKKCYMGRGSDWLLHPENAFSPPDHFMKSLIDKAAEQDHQNSLQLDINREEKFEAEAQKLKKRVDDGEIIIADEEGDFGVIKTFQEKEIDNKGNTHLVEVVMPLGVLKKLQKKVGMW